jgi:D-aminopeptidase
MGPYALKPGEGWTYNDGIQFTVKAGELQSTNGAAFIEYLTRKGEEPPDHTHPSEDEMFYVLEGVERCDERTVTYTAENAQAAYDVCRIALVLAGTVAKRERL